jgi:hypothetical protein
LEIYPLPHNSI